MNKTMIANIHIGDKIRVQLNENKITVADLARRINRSREATRDILNKKSINTDLLLNISAALNYDFFSEYTKVHEKRRF